MVKASASKIVGPQDWLRFTPAGHALLFTAVIVFLALLLQGRGFGRTCAAAPESGTAHLA